MQRWAKTQAGTPRFHCPDCNITRTWKRKDVKERHFRNHFINWLTGKQTLSEIAEKVGIARSNLSKKFCPLFDEYDEPRPPDDYAPKYLIVDGKYIHGSDLCVLIAVDENDTIWWKFVKSESRLAWASVFEQFPNAPDLVIADGQKGLYSAYESIWPDADFQRCHFHVVQRAQQHLTRNPRKRVAKELLNILYQLKEVNNKKDTTLWCLSYKIWEEENRMYLKERNENGEYVHKRLRKARTTVRKAREHLFVYLKHPGAPHTVNLVEGWVNASLAEAVRMHRGLKLHQQKTLVSIILFHLKRK